MFQTVEPQVSTSPGAGAFKNLQMRQGATTAHNQTIDHPNYRSRGNNQGVVGKSTSTVLSTLSQQQMISAQNQHRTNLSSMASTSGTAFVNDRYTKATSQHNMNQSNNAYMSAPYGHQQ